MDGKQPEKIHQPPKRRPNEDNPYKLYTAGIKTDHPHFYLSFRDSAGVKQFMEIDKALFDAFDRFELDDLSFMNEVDNHYEHAEQTEASLNRRAVMPGIRGGNCFPAHGGGGPASGHRQAARYTAPQADFVLLW